ncbi:HD-GYP domain-containing protein [Oceanithermus sp.]
MDKGDLYKHQLLEYAQDLARAYSQIRRSQAEFLAALVSLLEMKAPALRGHARRVAFWSLRLNDALGRPLDPGALQAAALVHDVGKLGLPDHLLRSWVADNEDDRRLLQLHPELGASLLEHVSAFSGWVPWVRHHHERWDGTGYPSGMAGEEIPLGARIIALANSFDYRVNDYGQEPAHTVAGTTAWIEEQAGRAFDPNLVAAFVALPIEALWVNRLWIEEKA